MTVFKIRLAKTVLDWGSMSDRSRYSVSKHIRARPWSLTLTYDLDFQSQAASYGHDPNTQKNSSSKVSRFNR